MEDEYDCIRENYKGSPALLENAKRLLAGCKHADGPRIICFLGSMTDERYEALKDFIRLRAKISDGRFEITQAMLHLGDLNTGNLPEAQQVRDNAARSLRARHENEASMKIARLNDDITRKCMMYDVMVNKGVLSQNVLDPERVEKFE